MQIVQQAYGSKVLSLAIPKGDYRVTWTAQGNDNFIVTVIRASGDDILLVNEIPPNPSSGQFLFPSPGGTYNVEIKASTLTWKLTLDQIIWPSGPGSTASVVNLSGQNSTITDPMYLAAGTYKLAWTSLGHGNFIVRLYWGGGNERLLVNEIPPNPSSGEVALPSGGGNHLLEIFAPSQDWTITITRL